MTHVLRRRGWVVAALFVLSCAWASAQEAPEGKPAPPKRPPGEQRGKLWQMNEKINRLLAQVAQTDPELKSLHEAQQAKWRAVNEKRMELIDTNPDLKKMREDLEAKRQKERELIEDLIAKSPEIAALRQETQELQGKLFQALRDNPDLKKATEESDLAWNELIKKASEKSPELAKAVEERDAMMKAAAPPPPAKPEAKEQPKE